MYLIYFLLFEHEQFEQIERKKESEYRPIIGSNQASVINTTVQDKLHIVEN